MSKNLVIVESPAKAKTIQKYLGKDFEVKSSFGHIRDLPKKGMGIDLKTFTPDYEVSADKKKLVTELKAAVKKAEIVWLASDEDREGEAIAWHLAQELKLKDDNTKRIVFHEITKNAILIVDFTNQLKAEGKHFKEALIIAGKERMRPILMTTLSMAIGMLPIALAKGTAAEWKNGLAWVIIGGLLSSLILTVFLVPWLS